MQMNFDNFQIQKRMSQTVRAQKVDGKLVSFDKLTFFLPELWSFNCPK